MTEEDKPTASDTTDDTPPPKATPEPIETGEYLGKVETFSRKKTKESTTSVKQKEPKTK